MCWNWMKLGRLFASGATNSGYGRRCAVERGRLWVLRLANGMGQLVSSSGSPSHLHTAAVVRTVIFSISIKLSCPSVPIIQWARKQAKTAHQERWYLTVRQRLGRFVRKTLSFSKSERNHELVTRWYIFQYNSEVRVRFNA
jgi:IS1 transposase